jgi:NADH-quinone oxidoreductase subunit N
LQYSAVRAAFSPDNALAVTGLGLLIVGFAFKVSSVPFHQWTPDVYQGAPTSVTAYMAITVKVAAFMALLRMLLEAFGPFSGELTGLFWVLAALSVVVGNVMAVIQDNLKRLLAYSSIAHAGYILIGFVAGGDAGHTAILFYLFVYVFMTLGAFAVIVALANRGRDCEEIDDLAGLARSRPALAALLTLFVLSLAGIPGTAGFMGKFLIFGAAVQTGHVGLAVLGVLASVVSVYYYLRVPVAMYMREPSDVHLRQTSSTLEIVVLGICAVAALYFGIFPNGGLGVEFSVIDWARVAAELRF